MAEAGEDALEERNPCMSSIAAGVRSAGCLAALPQQRPTDGSDTATARKTCPAHESLIAGRGPSPLGRAVSGDLFVDRLQIPPGHDGPPGPGMVAIDR